MLYDLLRSSSGLCLCVIGLGFLVEPARQRARAAFGILYISIGSAFLFSWLSVFTTLPWPLDLGLLSIIIYAMGFAVLEMNVYLFGDEEHRGATRKLARIGAAWSVLVWLLPFLDAALGLPAVRLNVEDQRPLAPFQYVAYLAVYAWPIAMSIASIRVSRYRLSDLPKGSRSVHSIGAALVLVIAILSVIGLGILVDSRTLYRLGQVALELGLVAWYLYIRARPDTFSKARADIGATHKKRLKLGAEEAAAIAAKLARVMSDRAPLADPDLDLPSLAKRAGIPAYRLSAYFNDHRGASFSDWLNAARIERACALLAERGDLGILDVAFDVGYSSKGAFNGQFQRRVGMTPSAYRASRKRERGAP